MNHSGKRENIFFILVFLFFYLFAASVVPFLALKMEFLSFGGLVAQSAVKPDIVFALVLCSAILSSRRRTVVLGIIFGFILDVTCSVPVLSSLCYCICGHYAASLSKTFPGRGAVNAVLVACPMLLMRAAVSTFYLLATWHNISFADILFGAVVPEYIYNILTVAVVFFVLRGLTKLFRIEVTL